MAGERRSIRIRTVRGVREVAVARRLFLEYQRSLGVDLCFQGFDEELRSLPGAYGERGGRLWIAWDGPRAIGIVALRRLRGDRAEMKRLYVRSRARGRGLGRRLVGLVLRSARAYGYRWIYLDTLPTMTEARALYRSVGFVPVAPYRPNPIRGSDFLRLRL